MNTKSHWLLAFLLLLAFGCGGGGSSGGTLPGSIFVSIQPGTDTLFPGCSAIFKATVAGSANQNVTWNAVGGSITEHGAYRAPGSTGTFVVIATSQADPTKSAQVTVNVVPFTGIVVSVSPNSTAVAPSQTRQFTAQVVGAPPNVTWHAARGTITSSGLYTAPNGDLVDTVVARSASNPAATGRADVTVGNPTVQVKITPLTPSLCVRETVQMSAQVSNATNTAVTWSATGGSIDANGLYTAPSADGTYDIRATSVQDPTKFATTQVTVKPIIITLTPSSVITAAGDPVKFEAVVTGPSNKAVTWSATGGQILQNGYYTAPANGLYTVTATSVSDPLASTTAQVEVANPVLHQFWDFTDPPPYPAWGPNFTWWFAHGRRIYGPEDPLSITDLPPHRGLRVSYYFYAIGDWRNHHTSVSLDGGYKYVTPGFSNIPGVSQSYPDFGVHPPKTGAAEVDMFGTVLEGGEAAYQLSVPLPHTGPSARVRWESAWSNGWIDNLRIEYFP